MNGRILCNHSQWKFQRIPNSKLAAVKELYDEKDWGALRKLYFDYKVVGRGVCPTCNERETILQWTWYAYEEKWLV